MRGENVSVEIEVPRVKWLITFFVLVSTTFFLTVKSVTNAITITLAIFSIYKILVHSPRYELWRERQVWLMFVCLSVPFVSELLAQMGRQSLVFSSLDGPLRIFLCGFLFIYLTTWEERLLTRLVRWFVIGAGLGVISVFVSLLMFPEQYWAHRAGTYFVDPITLPCFVVALFGVVLFSPLNFLPKSVEYSAKSVLLILTIYICIESYSRSSWVALVGLLLGYLWISPLGRTSKFFGVISLVIGFYAIYAFSEIVQARVDQAFGGLFDWIVDGGGQKSSTAQRMIMAMVDLEIVKSYPLFGIQDGYMPSYEALKSKYPPLNEEIYSIKVLAGSHNEFLAQIVRKGIVLGTLCLFGLFIYPVYLFTVKHRRFISDNAPHLLGIIGIVSALFWSGFSIQVFNLKMTSTFYGLSLSLYFAALYVSLNKERFM